jgi:hypothetical protein
MGNSFNGTRRGAYCLPVTEEEQSIAVTIQQPSHTILCLACHETLSLYSKKISSLLTNFTVEMMRVA